MTMTQNVQIISGAIDKAFKSGVYGVQEASQVLTALGALQARFYSEEMKAAPMEVVEGESTEEKASEKKSK